MHRSLRADPIMARLARIAGPVRLDRRFNGQPFEALARAIAHQQLHRAAAESILARLVALFGTSDFPQPRQLLEANPAQLRGAGLSLAKIAALRDLAAKTLEGVVPDLERLRALSDEQIIGRLTSVRGIGRWTVEMMLIFQLRRPDVLPVDDFGVRNGFRLAYGLSALPTPRALAQFGERWRPRRSAAAWYLWRAVELSHEQRLPRCPRPPRLALQQRARARQSRKPVRTPGARVTPARTQGRSAGPRTRRRTSARA